jgi:hypothetical protein
VFACVISLAANWHAHHSIRGLKDVVSWAGVFWIVRYAGIRGADQRLLAAIAVVAVLPGSLLGAIDLVTGSRENLELNSAGAVTQSVIYVGIAIMLALGLLFDRKGIAQERAAAARLLWCGVLILLLVIVFLMGSRGGVLAIGCAVAVTATIQRRRMILGFIVLAAAIGVITRYVLPDSVGQHRLWDRTVALVNDAGGSSADRERMAIWRIAIAQMQRPETWLVGIGPGNFEHISPQGVGEAEAARDVSRLTHAHNVFLNKFVEEGMLGLASFVTFLLLVAHSLATNARRARDYCTWQWYGALGGLVIPVVAGLFNAPWHQEHAVFAALALGMFLACTAGETRSKSECG